MVGLEGALWPPAHLLQQHMVRQWACLALQVFSHGQWRSPRVICDIRVLGLAPGAYVCHTFLPALLSERCLMGFSLGCNPSLALHLADFFNFLFLYIFIWLYWASQVALVVKNPSANAG